MTNFKELPIQAKYEMARDVARVLLCLHKGHRRLADPLIQELKARSTLLDENIQQDVLIFAEQVEFQFAYDPWHKITKDIQKAADHLLFHLGASSLLTLD